MRVSYRDRFRLDPRKNLQTVRAVEWAAWGESEFLFTRDVRGEAAWLLVGDAVEKILFRVYRLD